MRLSCLTRIILCLTLTGPSVRPSARRWRRRDCPPTGRPRRATYPSTGRSGTGWTGARRFAALLRALGRTGDAAALNRAYLDHLGEGSYLLPGAQALCRALAPRCTLAIVTNGVARAQRRRFEASPLNGLIPWLFISEELGASKPDPAFFAPVLRTLGNPDPRRVLMVGDNLLADIQGGIQAGLDTAWYNPGRLPGDPAIVPTWEVDGYAALQALILKEEKNNI